MKKTSQINWQKKIDEIQKRLIMSQAEIADHCGVVRQCVSNWKNGFREPGYHARRKLMELIGKMDNSCPVPANPLRKNKTSELISSYSRGLQDSNPKMMLKTISTIFLKLEALQRQEIFEFVLFKANRFNSNSSQDV